MCTQGHMQAVKYLLLLNNIIFCIKRPVCSCLNDLFLFCTSRIYYSSEAANVKIFSASSKNPTQSKKDVNRDAYSKCKSENVKELDVDDEEDIDNIGETEPVFKSFKPQEDEEVLIGGVV